MENPPSGWTSRAASCESRVLRKDWNATRRLNNAVWYKRKPVADIFAVGVRELQQLATLETDQVSEYIYGLSMGPQGRQILDAIAGVKDRRERLLSAAGDSGRLHELFEKYSRLAGTRRNVGQARDKHARLTRRRRELNDEIHDLQERESQITGELRGLRFIQSCYKTWKRIRDIQDELNRLPLISINQRKPSNSSRPVIATFRKPLLDATNSTNAASQFKSQAERLQVDAAFDKERYAIQSLVDQADWCVRLMNRSGRLKIDRQNFEGNSTISWTTGQRMESGTPERS